MGYIVYIHSWKTIAVDVMKLQARKNLKNQGIYFKSIKAGRPQSPILALL